MDTKDTTTDPADLIVGPKHILGRLPSPTHFSGFYSDFDVILICGDSIVILDVILILWGFYINF